MHTPRKASTISESNVHFSSETELNKSEAKQQISQDISASSAAQPTAIPKSSNLSRLRRKLNHAIERHADHGEKDPVFRPIDLTLLWIETKLTTDPAIAEAAEAHVGFQTALKRLTCALHKSPIATAVALDTVVNEFALVQAEAHQAPGLDPRRGQTRDA